MLKVWKAALALGIAGAAASFIILEHYTSTAILTYSGPGGWSVVREVINEVTSDAGLNIPNQTQRNRFREHLRIQPTREPDARAVAVSFEDSSAHAARERLGELSSSLIYKSRQRDPAVIVEVMDPATLPSDPDFPDHPEMAGAGCFLGLLGAIGLGIWRKLEGGRGLKASDADRLRLVAVLKAQATWR